MFDLLLQILVNSVRLWLVLVRNKTTPNCTKPRYKTKNIDSQQNSIVIHFKNIQLRYQFTNSFVVKQIYGAFVMITDKILLILYIYH
jgi:hypothetical protein